MAISHVECCDNMDFMSAYPDKFFDLAIVDPPYGIGEDGRKNHTRSKLAKSLNFEKNVRYDNNQPEQKYFDELFRVSKNIIIWGVNYIKFAQKDISTGCIVWDKVNGDNDFSDCELAWTNLFPSVRQFEYKWHGMMQGKSITEGRLNRGSKHLNEKRIHPNHKPIILYQWLLNKWAKKGDKVLDTHLGGGSNRIACDQLSFDFFGCELDSKYFNDQEKRFQQYKSQTKLF